MNVLLGNIALSTYQTVVVAAFAVMTVIGFAVMGIDKAKAKKGDWRIKESTLFWVAVLFGGVGTTLGMIIFRHKTKHWYFVVFMPILAVINVLAFYFLFTFTLGISPLMV